MGCGGGAEAQKNIEQDDKMKARAEYERREESCGGVRPACQRREWSEEMKERKNVNQLGLGKKNQRVLTLAWQGLTSPWRNAEALMGLFVRKVMKVAMCLPQLSIRLLVLTFTMCCNVTANHAPPNGGSGGGAAPECVMLA